MARGAGPGGRFQSHAGSIEAEGRQGLAPRRDEFQSHAGSIEAPPQHDEGPREGHVSIPRWFD